MASPDESTLPNITSEDMLDAQGLELKGKKVIGFGKGNEKLYLFTDWR